MQFCSQQVDQFLASSAHRLSKLNDDDEVLAAHTMMRILDEEQRVDSANDDDAQPAALKGRSPRDPVVQLSDTIIVELELVLRVCGLSMQVLQLKSTDNGVRDLYVNMNKVKLAAHKGQNLKQQNYKDLQLLPFAVVVHHLLQSEQHNEVYPEIKATLLAEIILNIEDQEQ